MLNIVTTGILAGGKLTITVVTKEKKMTPKFLQVVEEVEENQNNEESKDHYVVNYLKSMIALEEAMEPFKEQKKELRAEYIENGWLSKEEIWSAIKAFRMYQKSADLDAVNEMFDLIEKKFGPKEEV
tara:strand:- start:1409 stop:1789 length:381 start_codon:yes stop_codon:yes gene_type:complete